LFAPEDFDKQKSGMGGFNISIGKKIILGVVALLLVTGAIFSVLNKEKVTQKGQEQFAESNTIVVEGPQRDEKHDDSQFDEYEQQGVLDQHEEKNETESSSDSFESTSFSTEEYVMEPGLQDDSKTTEHSTLDMDKPEYANGSIVDDGNIQNPKDAVTEKQMESTQLPTKQIVDDETAAALWDNLDPRAKDVILGKYGNGKIRKESLGDQYDEIQSKVNVYYRMKYGN